MCMYCEKGKKLKSNNFCGSATLIVQGNILDIYGDESKFNIFKRIYRPRFDINYCPMCRKEAGRVKRYASGYWYQFIIPRRLTLPPVRIYRWLNSFWRLKDKEEYNDNY